MGLNIACFSANSLNYKGRTGWFRLASLLSRCTGCYGKSHEERQDYSQRPAVGLCSDRFPRGPGLSEGDGSCWELCLGQPLFHDLLNSSGTVEVAPPLLMVKFKTKPMECAFQNVLETLRMSRLLVSPQTKSAGYQAWGIREEEEPELFLEFALSSREDRSAIHEN